MTTFATNRTLLNPGFESYKLSPLDESEHVRRFPLTNQPTQANVSGRTKTPLSFEEVQARIKHNHLGLAIDGREAAYVDKELNFCIVEVDEVRSMQVSKGEGRSTDNSVGHECNFQSYE